MIEIKNEIPIGQTFINRAQYSNVDDIYINPKVGYWIVEIGNMIFINHDFQNGIVKKSFLKEYSCNYSSIYFLPSNAVNFKSYTSKMGYDINNNMASEEFNIPYDLFIKIKYGKENLLIQFLKDNNCIFPLFKDRFYDLIMQYINNSIKKIIGHYLKNISVEQIEENIISISQEIIKELNNENEFLPSIGLQAERFNFNISEDYFYRKEKQRIERDKNIINNRGF